MLGTPPPQVPSFGTPAVNHQFNQLLGTPTLKSVTSPFANSSYGGPSSSFFIPSSIPAQAPQAQRGGGSLQSMIAALQQQR